MMLDISSGHLLTLGNNIYTRKSLPTDIDLFKLNIRNTKKKCEICSKLTIKHEKDFALYFLLTFGIFYTFFFVSAVDFEQNTIQCSNNKLLQ